ncbi:MAG: OmpA family protein [Proteobacteria bacterium]|nr:OmpA family protein [Pseudomonadota bacterium]
MAVLGLVFGLGLTGCVTQGSHQEVVAERDRLQSETTRLRERVSLLETSNESLDSERAELLDQLEDLRLARTRLEEDVGTLRDTKETLSQSLAERERELAARTQEVGHLRGTYDKLVQELEAEVASGQIQIEQLREGLRVNVAQEILFPVGSANLDRKGVSVLKRVSAQLAGLPHRIEVQGHSDNVPVSANLARRYPSNWELAGARAASVVRLFTEAGVAGARLQATSYGEFHPVASNTTAKGRARNRRIEIRLVPEPDAGAKTAGSESRPKQR